MPGNLVIENLVISILDIVMDYIVFKLEETLRKKCVSVYDVNTTSGPVRGMRRRTLTENYMYSFERIPYAQPPLGNLRFKDPVPHVPWRRPKNCKHEGPLPMQTNIFTHRVSGSEDCLYLNIYSRNIKTQAKLPVIAFISCGGFEIGGTCRSLYGGDFLLQWNIVFVPINFRLGVLGFLCLSDPSLEVPGNAGLKDIGLALEWIKENISQFGGDPNNITLLGHSAGAACVHYLMMCEKTRTLFHKAILMSGTADTEWGTPRPNDWVYRLAELTGYKGTRDEKQVFKFLQKVKACKLIKAEINLRTKEDKQKGVIVKVGPVIEPYITRNTLLSTASNIQFISKGPKMPMIIGGVANEGMIFARVLESHPRKEDEAKKLVCSLLHEPHEELFENSRSPIEACLDLLSVKYFWNGIYETAMKYQQIHKGQVYLYRLEASTERLNRFRQIFCKQRNEGMCHADDLCYLFCNMFSCGTKKNSPGGKVIQLLTRSWCEFARTGNPNVDHPLSDNEKLPDWKPIQNDPPFCFNIDAKHAQYIPLPEMKFIELFKAINPNDFQEV